MSNKNCITIKISEDQFIVGIFTILFGIILIQFMMLGG